MRSKLILLALIGIVLMTAGSCSKEENYADLKIEKTEITLTKGDTAKVAIAQGSGSYQVTSSDTTIVKPELTPNKEILLIGRNGGTASVSVEDVLTKQQQQISVKVNLAHIDVTVSSLIELFNMRADRTGNELKNGQTASDKQKYSTLSKFQITFEGMNMDLEQEKIDTLNVFFKLSPVTRVDNKESFMKFLDAVASKTDAKHYVSFIGKYDADGKIPNTAYKRYSTKDEFAQALQEADWNSDLLRTCFRFNDRTNLEIRCDKGKLQIILCSLKTHDRWKWYFRFLGGAYDETLRELFFQVTNTGMIPPYSQLFAMKGIDRHSLNFNAVFIAPINKPISEIEMSFSDIEGNLDKIKETWFKMVDNAEQENNFGKFDRTIILPKNKSEQPIVLNSFNETKHWLNNNSPATVATFSPVFRSEDDHVIIPSIANSRLIIIVTTIAADNTSEAKKIIENTLR